MAERYDRSGRTYFSDAPDSDRNRNRINQQEGLKNKKRLRNSQYVQIQAGDAALEGNLTLVEKSMGLVIFVHGSGSSRHSPRNQYVADALNQAGLSTLLFDLLTPEEEAVDLRTRHLRFDIRLLAQRTIRVVDWLSQQSSTQTFKLGLFGASTGAAAALIAAAERPERAGAVVSRGGRPDLATSFLKRVVAPSLMIVGQLDRTVIELNEQAMAQMPDNTLKRLEVIRGAAHLFEEPGALEQVAWLATRWFEQYLNPEGETHGRI